MTYVVLLFAFFQLKEYKLLYFHNILYRQFHVFGRASSSVTFSLKDRRGKWEKMFQVPLNVKR